MDAMPKWADVVLIPVISLVLAALLSALVILAIGENPWEALKLMVDGAIGSTYGWGYTLYYATNFIFTGLAVAIAFHARMFNIGGEGQAVLGGLGVALVCLYIPWPHWSLALLGGTLGAALFGAAWAVIPAYLQAKRGSHIVITTIMFNFIAAALLNYLLVGALKPAGSMEPSTGKFPEPTHLPSFQDMFSTADTVMFRGAPANITFFVAIAACIAVWALIWRTRLGYEIRAFGHSESAAKYAGISPTKIIMISMTISGALAGMMAINNVMGEAERLVLNAVEGAGFIGIAVALMGRSHPFGVFLAAILFGFLYQGGAELALWTSIPRELIVVIQALVILFTGALDNMVRMPLESFFLSRRRAAQRKSKLTAAE
ncbi:ABC transporter permease [Loktanella salsilacus]|mgnify:FL=1|jgi:simple sugar transport system permease protein|uniref:Nucleoside ABC transporter membrane protein n=1 Tax=Loktanella salsilacus TaxID=195913 RepID=A0A1I4G1L0_9RHOB|nr:ABC transporter permease [Loktanella salsilacus]MBU0781558.1 ABC transporter permease [Alphaproteobacteria bacterium]MBU0862880.1 ABC transporter permease [Alphaproteobacteria bacterium]MBU1837998.1 ABC transporter permease [Alphaproteobacteria bacterium]UTH44804.1 ABC transporter permease [Loktanella salsilacus]UTH48529.1 ABC transporter permease [Loktanella salsilacus]